MHAKVVVRAGLEGRRAQGVTAVLFLLNSTVVSVASTVELPKGLEYLKRLSPAGVVNAGRELFQAHPRLETDKPSMAQWFCGLVIMKIPQATGALFAYGEGMPGMFARIADVPLQDIAKLYKAQREGARIDDAMVRDVWAYARPLI